MEKSLWPEARGRAAVAHSIVNGVGICALAAMHLWGSLDPQWAAGGVLLISGIWAGSVRKGPPAGPPGGSGALLLAARAIAQALGHHST